jgi:hypothetical protein
VPPWSGAALVIYKRSEAVEGYGPAEGSRKLRMRRGRHPRGRGVAGGRRLGWRPASRRSTNGLHRRSAGSGGGCRGPGRTSCSRSCSRPQGVSEHLHAMQFRAPPPPQVSGVRPAQPPSPSDRDYPLDTAGDRCLWHVGGTAGTNDDARAWRRLRLGRRVRPGPGDRCLVGKGPEGSRQLATGASLVHASR